MPHTVQLKNELLASKGKHLLRFLGAIWECSSVHLPSRGPYPKERVHSAPWTPHPGALTHTHCRIASTFSLSAPCLTVRRRDVSLPARETHSVPTPSSFAAPHLPPGGRPEPIQCPRPPAGPLSTNPHQTHFPSVRLEIRLALHLERHKATALRLALLGTPKKRDKRTSSTFLPYQLPGAETKYTAPRDGASRLRSKGAKEERRLAHQIDAQ